MSKFRGKTKEGKWVYGSLIIHNAYDLNDGTHKPEPLRTFIQEQDVKWKNEPNDKCWTHYSYEVIPETVGMFTGLFDKNGKEIYEGDIIDGNLFDRRLPTRGMVIFDNEHGCWANENKAGLTFLFKIAEKVVIGNQTDNPELLE